MRGRSNQYSCVSGLSGCCCRPVLIEVPHFASLRGNEREITILRSDNGQTWREHSTVATDEAVQDAMEGSFSGQPYNIAVLLPPLYSYLFSARVSWCISVLFRLFCPQPT